MRPTLHGRVNSNEWASRRKALSRWRFTEQYNRRAARFLKQHPALRSTYLKTLQLLEANPAHPSLRLHALRAKFDGLHSVSINLSYRITLELLIQDQQIIPVNVGDHDAVY
jgi:proteic killer suppression protein